MKVESLKFHKNNVDIVVDGEEYKKASLMATARFGLKEGLWLDEERFNEFLDESDKLNAKDYLLGLLGKGSKTEKEARAKLYERGYHKASVNYAINLAKEYRYLSDEAYAQNFVELNKSCKGAYRVERELKNKGVSDEIIAEVTKDYREGEDETAAELAKRFARGKDMSEQKTRERLFRHLASRGFGYDAIKAAMSAVNAACESEDSL